MSKIVLPYEPQSTDDRKRTKRREQTKEWLRKREREVAHQSPPLVPDRRPEDDALTPGKRSA
jgi:hypothetical protein